MKISWFWKIAYKIRRKRLQTKSEIIKQIAREQGLPVYNMKLSYTNEKDLMGIPVIKKS